MEHKLKINIEYLENLKSGKKKSEVRINDRDYQKDDILIFKEYLYDGIVTHKYKIMHIHSGLGLQPNYVVLSLEKANL